MKNFYTFLLTVLVCGFSLGQTVTVTAPGSQIAATNIESIRTNNVAGTADDPVAVFAFDVQSDALVDLTTIRLKTNVDGTSNTADWLKTIEGFTVSYPEGSITVTSTSVDASGNFLDINVSGFSISGDNTDRTATLSVFLKPGVIDADNGLVSGGEIVDGSALSFSITSVSSGFVASSGTVTVSDVDSNNFPITVDATRLTFLQQPTDVAVGIAMSPAVQVAYTDANGNIDEDVETPVDNSIEIAPGVFFNFNELSISSSNSNLSSTFALSASVPSDYNNAFAPDGIGTFDPLYFTAPATGVTLTVNDLSTTLNLAAITSDTFDVTAFTVGTTYTYNNGWTPSDPSGNVTSNDIIIVENGTATLTGTPPMGFANNTTLVYDVTVQPNGSLVVDSNNQLRVVNNMTLESDSDSFASFILDGARNELGSAVGGTIQYKRWVNSNTAGNDLIAPPLKGQDWNSFIDAAGTNDDDLLSGTISGGHTQYLFGNFDKASNNTYQLFPVTSGANPNLTIGRGYRAGTITSGTLTFSGDVETGRVDNIGVAHQGSNFPDWNLIGNPYPYYIDAENFLREANSTFTVTGATVFQDGGVDYVSNADLLQPGTGVYGYDAVGDPSDNQDGNGYRYIIVTAANNDTNLITPGQGFFLAVRPDAVSVGISVVFEPAMKAGSQTGDDFIVGRNTSTNPLTFLKLKLERTGQFSRTEFYFNDASSLGLDQGYDGRHLQNGGDFALFSHLVEDNTGMEIGLQSLNHTDLADTTVPLGVNALQGEQITFTIEDSTLPENVEVYLEDTVTNTFTLLNTGDYTLTPSTTLSGTGRFFLRLNQGVLSITETTLDDLSIYTNDKAQVIHINGPLSANTTASVYDLQGRMVSSVELSASRTAHTIDTSNFSSGVYVVQLQNETQNKTQKVIIN